MSRFRGSFVRWVPDLRSASLHLSGKGEGVTPRVTPSTAFPDGEERSAAQWIEDPGSSVTTSAKPLDLF